MKHNHFIVGRGQPEKLLELLNSLSIEVPNSSVYIYIDNNDNLTAPILNKIKYKYRKKLDVHVTIDLPRSSNMERFIFLYSLVTDTDATAVNHELLRS